MICNRNFRTYLSAYSNLFYKFNHINKSGNMGKRSRGFRVKTREKLGQKPGYRPSITRFLQEFKKNQKVVIVPEPSSHKGMPHSRYKGRVGIIAGTRGRSYIVEIIDGSRVKKLIARPEHLRTA